MENRKKEIGKGFIVKMNILNSKAKRNIFSLKDLKI